MSFAASQLEFLASVDDAAALIIVAPASALADGSAMALLLGCEACGAALASPAVAAMAADASPGSVAGSSVSTYIGAGGKLRKLVLPGAR